MNLKNLPRWSLTNAGLRQKVEQYVREEDGAGTQSEIDDEVNAILESAGFFHSMNRKPIPYKEGELSPLTDKERKDIKELSNGRK